MIDSYFPNQLALRVEIFRINLFPSSVVDQLSDAASAIEVARQAYEGYLAVFFIGDLLGEHVAIIRNPTQDARLFQFFGIKLADPSKAELLLLRFQRDLILVKTQLR